MKPATCHPEKRMVAKGFCESCYRKSYERARQRSGYYKRYREKNRERLREKNSSWQKANPEKCRTAWRRWYSKPGVREARNVYQNKFKATFKIRALAKKYFTTEEIIQGALQSPCEICGQNRPICIDHDPASGRFRGGLCRSCNGSLGNFGDNIEGLQKAIAYIDKFNRYIEDHKKWARQKGLILYK
jgi:hypothetical protein